MDEVGRPTVEAMLQDPRVRLAVSLAAGRIIEASQAADIWCSEVGMSVDHTRLPFYTGFVEEVCRLAVDVSRKAAEATKANAPSA